MSDTLFLHQSSSSNPYCRSVAYPVLSDKYKASLSHKVTQDFLAGDLTPFELVDAVSRWNMDHISNGHRPYDLISTRREAIQSTESS